MLTNQHLISDMTNQISSLIITNQLLIISNTINQSINNQLTNQHFQHLICSTNQLSPGGVCISMDSRCDNINDCDDRSDEADCSRVYIDPTYQKFIVPPPVDGKMKTEVILNLNLTQIMDIRQVSKT